MAITIGSHVRIIAVGHEQDGHLLDQVVTVTDVDWHSHWPYRAGDWLFTRDEIEEA